MSKKIPTVSVFKFFQHATRIVKNPLPFHHQNFEKHGDTFRLNLGFGKSVIFSRDPAFAQYALQKNQRNYQKSTIQTEDLAKYVGKGLLTAEGDHWRTQRRLIQPAFHKKELVTLLDKVQGTIQEELKRITTGAPIDVFPILNDLAFQTVVKALFGSAIDRTVINRLQEITEAAQTMLVRELRQPFLSWYFKYGGPVKKHIRLVEEARTILAGVVNERRQSGKRGGDLLDMLLAARYEDGNAMDEKQLIDEILILFSAGHETTSNALTFTLELLARHPKVQECVYDECVASLTVAKTNSEATHWMDRLRSMEYTKQVLEESMRLYPPAYFIDRVNVEEDEAGGYTIPKNSSLLFSIIEIHKHQDYWENPDGFDPDRFADNAGMKHAAYFPFGAGPRMCIGNNFAMYEMMITVAEVMLQYRIQPKNTPIAIKPLITLKPKNAILEFIPRT